MLMSSSRSGQWTCRPSPNGSQLSRSCKGPAWDTMTAAVVNPTDIPRWQAA